MLHRQPLLGALTERPNAGVPASGVSFAESDLAQVDAERVDELIHQGFARLAFPPGLETLYRRSIAHQRLRTVVASGILASVLFNWLLLSDWLMIPDRFDMGLRLRLFIFTPSILLGLLAVRRLNDPCHWETLMVSGGLLASGITAGLCVSSHDPYAGPYLSSLSVIVVFCNSVSRMRLRAAVILDSLIMVMFLLAWLALPTAPRNIMTPAALTLASCIVFTLYGAYCLEHDDRENWLLWLRERLLQAELRLANDSLRQASQHDVLTQLSIRHHFDLCLSAAWTEMRERGGTLALVIFDLDEFRQYNQRLGAEMGDECLRLVAQTLKDTFAGASSPALTARYSGQEFAVALHDTSLQRAVALAEQARRAIQAMHCVTSSVGVSCGRPQAPHASVAQVIAAAEEALHLAQTRGGNRVIAFGTQD